MARASPGPMWATMPEPTTSSAATSEDEMDDEELSREEIPQSLKRKSGPLPANQKRPKLSPPDETRKGLLGPRASWIETSEVTSAALAGPSRHQSPKTQSQSILKIRPPGVSPAKTRVVSRKGKQKAQRDDGDSDHSPSNSRPSSVSRVARKRAIPTFKPSLPTPRHPKPIPSGSSKKASPEIMELTSSSDEASQIEKPPVRLANSAVARRPPRGPPSTLRYLKSRFLPQTRNPSSASFPESEPEVTYVCGSDEEPETNNTSSAQSPCSFVKHPLRASSAIVRQERDGGNAASSKPPLPRRKPASQASISGTLSQQQTKGTTAISQANNSVLSTSVDSATAPRPPLPKRSSGIDMSGLKEVLESPTPRASERAATSPYRTKISPGPPKAATRISVLSVNFKDTQKLQPRLREDQPSAEVTALHNTPSVVSSSPEIRRRASRDNVIDLTLEDSDAEMASPSTYKTVDEAIASSPFLKSLLGSVTSAEVDLAVDVPMPSTPPLPKRTVRNCRLIKEEIVSPSVNSTPNLEPDQLTPSFVDAASHPGTTEAPISLAARPPLPKRNVQHWPPEQVEPQQTTATAEDNGETLSSSASSSSKETSPQASSADIEMPHRRARKTTGGMAVAAFRKRIKSISPEVPTVSPPPPPKGSLPRHSSNSPTLDSPVAAPPTPPSPPDISRQGHVEPSGGSLSSETTVNQVDTLQPLPAPVHSSSYQQDEVNFDDILEYVDDPFPGVNGADTDSEIVERLLTASSHSPIPEASGRQELSFDPTDLGSSPQAIDVSDDEDLLQRRRTLSSRSSSDEPANFFAHDEYVETPSESLPPSPSPDPAVPIPVKRFGGFTSLNWKTYRQDLRNFNLKCYFAKDLPHSLQDHINQWEESLRLQRTLAIVLQSAIQENTADDEPDAPMIDIINDVDDEPTPPWEFYYTNKMWHGEGVPPPDINTLKGCNCMGKCDPKSKTCACVQRQQQYTGDVTPDFAYDMRGRLKILDYPIFECNDLCGCDEDCRNRVVQLGRKVAVSVQKTADKGWGVFSGSKKIYEGTFIGIYSGELLTDAVGERRGLKYNKFGRTYLFDLDFHYLRNGDEHWSIKYTVDAYHAGNFTRFLNHSCDPNCRLVPCYINESNIDKPLLAVFAQRDIEPFEEICFSYYGDPDDEDEQRAFSEVPDDKQDAAVYAPCACKAKNCRGKMFI